VHANFLSDEGAADVEAAWILEWAEGPSRPGRTGTVKDTHSPNDGPVNDFGL
jgi:hypothetical protein